MVLICSNNQISYYWRPFSGKWSDFDCFSSIYSSLNWLFIRNVLLISSDMFESMFIWRNVMMSVYIFGGIRMNRFDAASTWSIFYFRSQLKRIKRNLLPSQRVKMPSKKFVSWCSTVDTRKVFYQHRFYVMVMWSDFSPRTVICSMLANYGCMEYFVNKEEKKIY